MFAKSVEGLGAGSNKPKTGPNTMTGIPKGLLLIRDRIGHLLRTSGFPAEEVDTAFPTKNMRFSLSGQKNIPFVRINVEKYVFRVS